MKWLKSNNEKYLAIEYPSCGKTYSRDEYGVYQYDEYPRGSVLEGQERRVFVDSFEKLEEAQQAYPEAEVSESCGYKEPYLGHLPDDEDY